MRSLPIRLRLTVWYGLFFAVATLLLTFVSYRLLRRSIDLTIQQEFHERLDDLREQLHQVAKTQEPESIMQRIRAAYETRDDGKWLQVRDERGQWVYRSPRMLELGADLPLPESLLPQGALISKIGHGNHAVRTFSSAVPVDGVLYSAELGVSLAKPEALLRGFRERLLILVPVVLLGVLAGAHWMSRTALQPLTVLAEQARQIDEKTLHHRLPVVTSRDEVADLSVTLNSMLARIDAGHRSVRDFMANASHELRTPLARLRTEIEIALLFPRSNAAYHDTLSHAQMTTIEMTEMVDGLLALARADAGQESVQLISVDSREVVMTACRTWSVPAAARGLRLEVASAGCDAQQPVYVEGNGPALARLLNILLDNACKFTPSGGRILLGIDCAVDTVTLSVAYSGAGIAAEHQQRVFERFYRVPLADGRQHEGAGLGLSLAAWIAQQHASSLALESSLGAGSRFSIRLPRAQPYVALA